jgi:hypothetical protein
VVGRDAKSLVTGEPSTRVGFQGSYERRDREYEAVAGEYPHCTTFTTKLNIFVDQPVAWSFSVSGSNNVHVHNNTIIAVSYSSVSELTYLSLRIGLIDLLLYR